MIKIRRNIFETNSSSTHSLCLCKKDDYEKWRKRILIYDKDLNELVPVTDAIIKYTEEKHYNEKYFIDPSDFEEWIDSILAEELYEEKDDMVVFGYYDEE